jgi:ubiquitin C-terminal hydrolase
MNVYYVLVFILEQVAPFDKTAKLSQKDRWSGNVCGVKIENRRHQVLVAVVSIQLRKKNDQGMIGTFSVKS